MLLGVLPNISVARASHLSTIFGARSYPPVQTERGNGLHPIYCHMEVDMETIIERCLLDVHLPCQAERRQKKGSLRSLSCQHLGKTQTRDCKCPVVNLGSLSCLFDKTKSEPFFVDSENVINSVL